MTPKQIFYSGHAAKRLRERRITRQQVRWLLAEGIREIEMEGSAAHEAIFSKRGYLGKVEAAVIYLERANHLLVVTVMFIE